MRKGRNGYIELMRFLFSIMVVLLHGRNLGGGHEKALFAVHGGIAVEYFFIVSGYLMARSASKYRDCPCDQLGKETVCFLWHKIVGFLPYYCLASIFNISYLIIAKNYGKQKLLVGLWDFLLLSATGVETVAIVDMSWYLSAMLLAMAILYPVLRKYNEFYSHLLGPLLSVLILGYLSATYGSIKQWLSHFNVLCGGLLRAVAELSLGVGCYTAVTYLSRLRVTKFTKILAGLASVGGFAVVFYMANNAIVNGMDATLCLIVAFSTILAFWQCDWRFFRNSFFSWLGELSLVVYLNHRWVQFYIRTYLPAEWGYKKLIIILMISTLVVSVGMMLLWHMLKKLWSVYGTRISRLFLESDMSTT